jgi:hypothetical protein
VTLLKSNEYKDKFVVGFSDKSFSVFQVHERTKSNSEAIKGNGSPVHNVNFKLNNKSDIFENLGNSAIKQKLPIICFKWSKSEKFSLRCLEFMPLDLYRVFPILRKNFPCLNVTNTRWENLKDYYSSMQKKSYGKGRTKTF